MLERTQKGGLDITGWLDWFLRCLDRAFDGTDLVDRGVLEKEDAGGRSTSYRLVERRQG